MKCFKFTLFLFLFMFIAGAAHSATIDGDDTEPTVLVDDLTFKASKGVTITYNVTEVDGAAGQGYTAESTHSGGSKTFETTHDAGITEKEEAAGG